MEPHNFVVLNDITTETKFARRPTFRRKPCETETVFRMDVDEQAHAEYRLMVINRRPGKGYGVWIWDCVPIGDPFQATVNDFRGEVFPTDFVMTAFPGESQTAFDLRVRDYLREHGLYVVGGEGISGGPNHVVYIVSRKP